MPMRRYQSDRAVQKKSDDLLGRSRFAEQLASALVGWKEDESLVVALTGAWGAGKTSIKNFVVEALQIDRHHIRADVLEFSAWDLSAGDIEKHFFGRIGEFLGRGGARADKKIARKWAKWAAALQLSQAVGDPVSRYVPIAASLLLAGVGSALTSRLGHALPLALAAAVCTFGIALPIVALLFERTSAYFAARANVRESSPQDLKEELATQLRARERPLIVIVDDVDRLTSAEIPVIFRLIKANADLPRMLYLILFENEAVIHALDREGFLSGERYLEKIVQASFAVPSLERTRLHDVLTARLNEILAQHPEGAFDSRRWIDLFFQRLQVYFRTLRDVYRFLATYEFQIAMFRHGDSFEVNATDLFVLEILHMFEPDVWKRLPDQKHLLVRGQLAGTGSDSEPSKIALNALVNGSQNPAAVTAALIDLFPLAGWAWGGTNYGDGFYERWVLQRRVGTDIHFDKYFYLAAPRGDLTQGELDAFVVATASREKVRTEIQRYKADGRIERLLLRLEYEKDRVPIENASSFFTALLDEGDELPERTGFGGIDADMHLARVVYWYLRRLDEVSLRERVLRDAIENTTGLYAPCHIVSMEEPREGANSRRERAISLEALPEFEDLCVQKIRAAAESGALLDHRRMVWLLYRWNEWRAGEATAWATSIISDRVAALKFLYRSLQVVRRTGWGSVITDQVPTIRLKDLETFVPLEQLDAILSDPPPEDPKMLEAVQLFRNALHRRRRGLPDRDRLSLSDDDD